MKKAILAGAVLLFGVMLPAQTITFNPGQPAVGQAVHFTADFGADERHDGEGPVNWSFGDGQAQPGAGRQADHVFREPGAYTVTATRGDQTVQAIVNVIEGRRVEIQGSRFTVGSPIQFKAKNFVEATMLWDFGDGRTEPGGKNIRHAYAAPGPYTVRTRDAGGASPTEITVSLVVEADTRLLALTTPEPKARQVVAFSAQNFPTSSLRWDFGDGRLENGGVAMSHVYMREGSYTVKAWDSAQDAASAASLLLVVAASDRSLEASAVQPRACETLTLTARQFHASNLRWDFGDGRIETGGATITHLYERPGAFKVQVRATDEPADCAVPLDLVVQPDNRSLGAVPATPRAFQEVSLTARQFAASSLRWDFGDGRSQTGGESITHTYERAGTFKVQARLADDPSGCAVTLSLAVQPDNRRVDLLTGGDIWEGAEISLAAANFQSADLRWDFGDGQASGGTARTTHRYARPGSYRVRVSETVGAAVATAEKVVSVSPDPRQLVVRPQTMVAGVESELQALRFRGPTVAWDFGDGTRRSGGLQERHIWSRPGQYVVRAVDHGGSDARTFEQAVQVETDTREIVLPTEVIEGEPVDIALRNASGGSFSWRFGDGQGGSGAVASGRVFRSPGLQRVTVDDASKRYPPLQKQFMVVADNRALQSKALFALPEEALRFQAVNFRGPRVRWDFGDGTVREGANAESHAYARSGRFRVTATDFSGQSRKPFSLEVVVAEQSPDFAIHTLQLTFADGAYYKMAGRNTLPPGYNLMLKTSGRGILRGQILLDGAPLALFHLLVTGGVTSLPDSQKPRLPLIDLGLHRLTVKFENFGGLPRVPILRYFVAENEGIRITSPLPGSRLPAGRGVVLHWKRPLSRSRFQVTVSEIPLQFLSDNQIEWRDAGEVQSMKLQLGAFKPGAWVYWQVREVDGDRVLSMSDYASFRVAER